MLAWLLSRNAGTLNKLYALTLAGVCLLNGTTQIHCKTIGRSKAINVWSIGRDYYSAKELPNLDFFTNAIKREKGRKHSLNELPCQMCQSAGREQKRQQCVQLTILIFVFNEIRGGVWLVWHRNCQALTLQRLRSEHSSCCLPGGTQELVQVFEIQGLSIIKKKVTLVAGKHCSRHWSDFI